MVVNDGTFLESEHFLVELPSRRQGDPRRIADRSIVVVESSMHSIVQDVMEGFGLGNLHVLTMMNVRMRLLDMLRCDNESLLWDHIRMMNGVSLVVDARVHHGIEACKASIQRNLIRLDWSSRRGREVIDEDVMFGLSNSKDGVDGHCRSNAEEARERG